MNLTQLSEIQKILDARIEKEHPILEGEDRLAKKILALQVELGECANEWRGFKFWSTNQKPNISKPVTTFYGSRNGETTNPLLEEYVDCLHFILSIGLELKIHVPQTVSYELSEPMPNDTEVFIDLIQGSYWFFRQKDRYPHHLVTGWVQYFSTFHKLGEILGFTWDQIEQAYYNKNAINHDRQDTGY